MTFPCFHVTAELPGRLPLQALDVLSPLSGRLLRLDGLPLLCPRRQQVSSAKVGQQLSLVAFLLLVVRPGALSSFLFLVAMPGAPSSVLVGD